MTQVYKNVKHWWDFGSAFLFVLFFMFQGTFVSVEFICNSLCFLSVADLFPQRAVILAQKHLIQEGLSQMNESDPDQRKLACVSCFLITCRNLFLTFLFYCLTGTHEVFVLKLLTFENNRSTQGRSRKLWIHMATD